MFRLWLWLRGVRGFGSVGGVVGIVVVTVVVVVRCPGLDPKLYGVNHLVENLGWPGL